MSPTLTKPYTKAERARRRKVLDDTRVESIEPTRTRAAELQRTRDLENEIYRLKTQNVKLTRDLGVERGLNDTLIRERDASKSNAALAAIEVIARVPVSEILRLGVIQSVDDLIRWRNHLEALGPVLEQRRREVEAAMVPVATRPTFEQRARKRMRKGARGARR
jgi:hypothetical protein